MNKAVIKKIDDKVPHMPESKSLTLFSAIPDLEKNKQFIKLISVDIPKNIDILQTNVDMQDDSRKKIFLYRNFLVYKVFEGDMRENFKNDINQYEEWKKMNMKTTLEFALFPRSREQKNEV